jgi:hypothetical protein
MDESLASIEDLQARLDWVLDVQELSVAASALADLSDDARFYGSATWLDENTCPRQAKSIVLRAAARFMRNPDAYTQSRAGDETLMWADQGEGAGTPHFNEKEEQMLARIAGGSGSTFHSVELVAWGPRRATGPGYVPVDPTHYEQKPRDFPFFAEEYI